jgi:hypothetical protein
VKCGCNFATQTTDRGKFFLDVGDIGEIRTAVDATTAGRTCTQKFVCEKR